MKTNIKVWHTKAEYRDGKAIKAYLKRLNELLNQNK